MRHDKQTGPKAVSLPSPARRKTVVIADDGIEASVVLLDVTHPAAPGSSFDHLGRRWVIRGQRHHSRVLVAEPLARVQQ
jgi:hypothetical protein